MVKTGRVLRTEGTRAWVRVPREGACGGSCGSCGVCVTAAAEVVAENAIGAQVGQRVTLELPGGSVLQAAFMTYILPLIFALVGYFAGGAMGGVWPWACAAGGFFLALLLARAYAKSNEKKLTSVITGYAEE